MPMFTLNSTFKDCIITLEVAEIGRLKYRVTIRDDG
jgi:hypothetical protein